MSTDPATVLDPTAATEAVLDIESIKELMDAFDPASLLPELGDVFSVITTICQIAVMVGPIILLVLGLAYLFFSPREANYYFGYRCYFGMGSVGAWRFTQRLAGIVWAALGLILTVVMVLVTGKFAGGDVMQVVDTAVTCLLWEIALAMGSALIINLIVALSFDAKGYPRRNKKDIA